MLFEHRAGCGVVHVWERERELNLVLRHAHCSPKIQDQNTSRMVRAMMASTPIGTITPYTREVSICSQQ
jgi:hypothetical protein